MKLKRNLNIALVKALTGRNEGNKYVFAYCGDNPLERIITIANTHNPDILVAPEFMFYDGKRILTADEKKSIEKIIANEVHKKDMLIIPGSIMWHNPNEGGIAKNTSPVITNGKVIAEHMKASDGGCGDIAKEHGLGYAEGPESGAIFPWNGLEIGLEICADHAYACLLSTGKKVDIHIVPASGISHHAWNNCSKDKGYFILCDGFKGHNNKVLQKKGAGRFEPVYPTQENSNVDIYNVQAEVEDEYL